MTGKQILEFLQKLSENELKMDVEIRDGDKYWWVMGVGIDCNGIYVMDDETTALFVSNSLKGDKLLSEGGTYEF